MWCLLQRIRSRYLHAVSEAEWFRQNSYENAIWDYNHKMYRAEQRGLEKGIEKGKVESAKNLLKLNKLSCDEIAQCCSLPIEEIKKLKEELETKS